MGRDASICCKQGTQTYYTGSSGVGDFEQCGSRWCCDGTAIAKTNINNTPPSMNFEDVCSAVVASSVRARDLSSSVVNPSAQLRWLGFGKKIIVREAGF